ncbi:hypothetical protein CS022_14385 [Veronia nyctiphanis]|uniref:DoxX family protein n=1 Tax=Veronia nyctiphanis TaxID=1278244 RepID=A0A4Q0YNU3_9GAMM|nr:DoxX family protein [Veronia nyctiphanis]RXJ72632.1 hypothetical protein CS022_14385 [Veronia nyctiphanis]
MSELIRRADSLIENLLTPLVPVLLLLSRLWIAWVFFRSGMIKVSSWDSTLYLFENEYVVPLLPWEIAAYLGTGAELVLPVLLALGILARPAAIALFAFNIVAVVSYPTLWAGGFFDHQMWGVMLLANIILGPGLLAMDNIFKKQQ